MLSGTAMGYMMYDMMHYYLHHGSPQYNYLKDLKNYHVRHHYVHQEKGKKRKSIWMKDVLMYWRSSLSAGLIFLSSICISGFGISSKFWDIPFGTVIPSKSAWTDEHQNDHPQNGCPLYSIDFSRDLHRFCLSIGQQVFS